MWPMLLELLPHFTRLLPMADKYLSTRSASEKAQEAALAALGAEVRGELGQLGEVLHTGIQRQLQDQGAQLTELAVEVTRARMGVESMEARVAGLERAAAAMRWLAVASLVGLAGVIGLLVAVLERLRAH
jgi:chromosome segregation ATPase